MSRNKKLRYAETKANPIVIEPTKEVFNSIKGNWKKDFFQNNNPIVVEFACGKGEYTVGMAERNPNKNYIGVDIKGGRLWNGCKEVDRLGLKNVGFLRIDIHKLNDFFEVNEVDEIWITFPDPQPKNEKHRLTNISFLEKYKKVLKSEGKMNFKTDNSDLFDYSLKTINEINCRIEQATKNLYKSPLYQNELTIKTAFEKKFNDLGFDINYVKFSF